MSKFVQFMLTFAILFGLTVLFLALVDSLPNPPGEPVDQSQQSFNEPVASTTEYHETASRIVAKDISLDAVVSNPTSTDVDVLDAELLKGVVRYPTSALLGEQGTVLIFGHSSYLPIVHNQNYKAFDGIQNLKPGQIVSVYSANREYRYSVTGVRQANVNDDPIIELPQDGQHLTLITCDSFKTKSDRFIVTADFLGAFEQSAAQ